MKSCVPTWRESYSIRYSSVDLEDIKELNGNMIFRTNMEISITRVSYGLVDPHDLKKGWELRESSRGFGMNPR
jgi:hypothetical protein